MTSADVLPDLDKLLSEFEAAGIEWADRHAEACLKEELQPHMLICFVDAIIADSRARNLSITRQHAERHAKGQDDWRKYITDTIEARRVANQARNRWRAAEIRLEREKLR